MWRCEIATFQGSWKHPQTFKLELKKPISMYSMCHKKGIVVSNPWVPEMLYPRRRRACACFSSFFRVLFAVSIGLGSSAKSFPCSSASGFSWKKTHAESWMRLAVTGCELPPPRMPVVGIPMGKFEIILVVTIVGSLEGEYPSIAENHSSFQWECTYLHSGLAIAMLDATEWLVNEKTVGNHCHNRLSQSGSSTDETYQVAWVWLDREVRPWCPRSMGEGLFGLKSPLQSRERSRILHPQYGHTHGKETPKISRQKLPRMICKSESI